MKSTLMARVFSAIAALLVVAALYYFLRQNGLLVLILLGALISQVEFSTLVISKQGPSFSRILLVAGCFIICLSAAITPTTLGMPVGIILVTFFSFFLVHYRKLEDLESIRNIVGISALGLLYVGILPAFIVATVRSDFGDLWFFSLLAIVFGGDTFAYFVGRAVGNKKLLPTISPNKTWAGAIGGIFGSVLAASLIKLTLFPEIPTLPMVVLAILTGAFAQVGDLFESLLKRVAGKKDSGALMPGHGGMLDRIDGVLFGAPFVYFASQYFSSLF